MSKKTFLNFSAPFWVANFVELLERAAYYGVFIAMTLYLSRILGFTDIEAAWIAGPFGALLYLLPTFSGAYADKIGFRKALMLAFLLLTIGYAGMGILPAIFENAGMVSYGEETIFKGLENNSVKYLIIPILLIVVVGGSFIKSVITGTVSKETTPSNRARGFSIFYAMVNIGAFSGKLVVKPLRISMGDEGLFVLNFFAASMTLIALLAVFLFYRSSQKAGQGKSLNEILNALGKVFTNGRLITLILIVTGFWMVQSQLYATMPKYVLRMAGEGASPSWYANVNPFVVFTTVGIITELMRRKTALFSMTIGMFIMPVSAFAMATGNFLEGETMGFINMHPVAFMMVVGIAFQGLAEAFISPRFLEFFSLQAPKGEEGLYLGFSHLHSFISHLVGFGMSGYLLSKYCPDPKLLSEAEKLTAYDNAHYIWYYFVAIAAVSAVSLIVFGKVTAWLDAKKAAQAAKE
jgi:dipeptide/tripeptide permease